METNGWCAPDHNLLDLVRIVTEQFANPNGGPIDHMAFYLDPQGAAEWCFRINQGTKAQVFFGLPAHWTQWATGLILRHLKGTSFDQDRIDVLGLGVGDGKKETTLCDTLAKQSHLEQLYCVLLDISPASVEQAHAQFLHSLGTHPRARVLWALGNYHNLPSYADLFQTQDSRPVLKVGTLFSIIDNVRYDAEFIEESLCVFKSGDLIVIDCCLGYAPPDEMEIIQQEDPSLTFLRNSSFHWFNDVVRRYCPDPISIDLGVEVSTERSGIPNSYTLDTIAVVNKKTRFSLMVRHRYVAEDFVHAFETRGWKPLGGLTYGPDKKQLLYIFAKK